MNCSKTEALLITSKQIAQKIPFVPVLHIGDDAIAPNDAVRYIGILMDKHLTMDDYITSLCKSAYFHLYNIGRIRRLLTQEACEQLIHAFITSRLDYCNAVLYGIPRRLVIKLQRVQNVAARILTMTRKYEHITPVLRQLHWIPVAQRIDFKIALTVFKCQHGLGPDYLSELLEPHDPQRSLRSASHRLLNVPRSNSALSDRAFGICAPKVWNDLDFTVRSCDTLPDFKRKLKTFYFRVSYDLF